MDSFIDRADAGMVLSGLLKHYRGQRGIVLAIPRGGVPVGAPIARELRMPLEPLFSKKIGHPYNPEYAIGAVTLEDRVVRDPSGVPEGYIEAETLRLRSIMLEQSKRLWGLRKARPLEGCLAIVVDDGIATGSTLLCTLPMLRRKRPSKIIVAVPVAPADALAKLEAEADEVVCAYVPEHFSGVGAFYADFRQVEDEEARRILEDWMEGGPQYQAGP